MRTRYRIVIGLLAAFVSVGAPPRGLVAQGRTQLNSASALTVVVPSIIRVELDPTAPVDGGAPRVRVLTNDPALRAALAAGGDPGSVGPSSAARQAPSHHAKGAEALEPASGAPSVFVYTIASP